MIKGVYNHTGYFKGYDGLGLFYQKWTTLSFRSGKKGSKSAIVIVHGVGEHSSRYGHVGEYFADLGYQVYAYDQRGNGYSAGKRGHIKGFNEYIYDLKYFIEFVKKNVRSDLKHIYILGHSLGGLITIRFTMDNPEGLSGVILSSPALGLSMHIPFLKKVLGYGLNSIYPGFTMVDSGIPSDYLSHDPKIGRIFDADPLVHRKRSARFLVEFIETMKKTASEPHNLTTPCLFLQAGDDRIVSVEALKRFYNGVASKHKDMKIYPSFYHEILNEKEKRNVLIDIKEWLASLAV